MLAEDQMPIAASYTLQKRRNAAQEMKNIFYHVDAFRFEANS